jgi:glycine/D-amino acid oxidase-like deaminating enzyme
MKATLCYTAADIPSNGQATGSLSGLPVPPIPGGMSWWFLEAIAAEGGYAPAQMLEANIKADVAIVGGGYTGLWAAIALKEADPTLSIVLVERGLCGMGASGKNGGKVHGYWSSLPHLSNMIGVNGALALASLGRLAQDAIRTFAKNCDRDVWWREDGGLKVSAAPAQDSKIADTLEWMQKLGVPDLAKPLTANDVRKRCLSPVFRSGIFYPEEATVHPARLVRAMRAKAIVLGIQIYENTPLNDLTPGLTNTLMTANGSIQAKEVILATNVDLLKHKPLAGKFMAFSSYALMTEPVPALLDAMNWTTDCSITDARSFLHYFRKTPDGRVLMGSGSGPIAYGSDITSRAMTNDHATIERTLKGLKRLLPALAPVGVSRIWGAAIDVSADRIPYAGTIPNTRIHYAYGYSGHGVNPTYIIGQCLKSLVLKKKDLWGSSPICQRQMPRLPPEPFRYLGGAVIRRAILACEDAEEQNTSASTLMRAIASLPSLLHLKIGSR